MFDFKKITVPETNATKEVDAIQLWEVRWDSRYGQYISDVQPEVEAFPSEEEANEFKEALVNAFKLIKHTSGNTVTVRKAK